MISIQITEKGKGRQWWKELLALYLKEGERFEIHCWKNEKDEIADALKEGVLEKTNWEYGEVITGILSETFIRQLLEGQVSKTDVYEKHSPYFTLKVGGIFSEHYGTEIYIEEKPENESALKEILSAIAPFASISESESI